MTDRLSRGFLAALAPAITGILATLFIRLFRGGPGAEDSLTLGWILPALSCSRWTST